MTADCTPLLGLPVSYFKSAYSPPSSEISVQDTLCAIREGKIRDQVHFLRDLLAKALNDQYADEKKRLPAVTFSATFSGSRKLTDLAAYNPLLVLDVDHLPPDDLASTSDYLATIPYVLARWLSPSGQGLKGLIGLSFPAECTGTTAQERHRSAFIQVATYLATDHNVILDRSGSDISRLCFLSSDPTLYFHVTAPLFPVSPINTPQNRPQALPRDTSSNVSASSRQALLRHVLYRTEEKNRARDRTTMKSILKYLEKRRLSITSTYATWLRVGYAIASTFSYDIGCQYYLRLCRLDGGKHDELASVILLQNCYLTGKGIVRIGTIKHLAHGVGYMTTRDGG